MLLRAQVSEEPEARLQPATARGRGGVPLVWAAPSPREAALPASITQGGAARTTAWPWRLSGQTQEGVHGPLGDSDLRIAAPDPYGINYRSQ